VTDGKIGFQPFQQQPPCICAGALGCAFTRMRLRNESGDMLPRTAQCVKCTEGRDLDLSTKISLRECSTLEVFAGGVDKFVAFL